MKKIDPALRFWPKVDKSGECWLWTAKRAHNGYGRFWDGRRWMPAHRWLFEQVNGAQPAHIQICHHCDNPPCVRPEHLFAGTGSDNALDSARKGRRYNVIGANNGRAKIDSAIADAIRVKVNAGTRRKVIAQQYGISEETIRRIVRRQIWVSSP